MISYLTQIAICEPVLETVKQTLSRSDDAEVRRKAGYIPTKESVLRAVTLYPDLDTKEKLKNFIIEHVLSSVRITPAQKEHLDMNGLRTS